MAKKIKAKKASAKKTAPAADTRRADALRKELAEAGITMTTTPEGNFAWSIRGELTQAKQRLLDRANEARRAGLLG